MPVIHTSRNRVVADEPEAADAFVKVVWFGPPQDGRHRKQFHTRPQPIEQYQEAVEWAVSMADVMEHPLYVVPLTMERAYPRGRLEQLAAGMTDQERGELRQFVVTMCPEVMRDCDEIEVRDEAFRVLAKMGVVKQ